MPNDETPLMTAKEKAAELSISRSTLSRLVASGKVIPAYRDTSNPRTGVTLFHPETPSLAEDHAS